MSYAQFYISNGHFIFIYATSYTRHHVPKVHISDVHTINAFFVRFGLNLGLNNLEFVLEAIFVVYKRLYTRRHIPAVIY